MRAPQDRGVVLRCSKESYEAHLKSAPGGFDLLPSLRLIQAQFKGRLTLLQEEGETWVMAFPVPTVFEQVLRLAHGVDAPRFVYVWGEIPRDTVNEHHKTNQRPIGIILDEIFLADAKRKVHPFVFCYHDTYHAVMAAALPQPLRRLWARLYDLVGRFPFSPADKDLREDLLDALTNHDIERRPETPVMTLALVPFRPLTDRIVEGFQGDLDEGLDRLEESAAFLEDFLRLLKKADLGLTDPEEISWRERLERDLIRLWEELNPKIVVKRALREYGF